MPSPLRIKTVTHVYVSQRKYPLQPVVLTGTHHERRRALKASSWDEAWIPSMTNPSCAGCRKLKSLRSAEAAPPLTLLQINRHRNMADLDSAKGHSNGGQAEMDTNNHTSKASKGIPTNPRLHQNARSWHAQRTSLEQP